MNQTKENQKKTTDARKKKKKKTQRDQVWVLLFTRRCRL